MADLLSDAEVLAFVRRGYHIVSPGCGPAVHAAAVEQAEAEAPSPVLDGFVQCPALLEVCRDERVVGALTSLAGEGYTLEVHGARHYVEAGQGGQSQHQDGQWRRFGGWNRHHARRWHLPRKLMCFYYPHDVVSAPSEVVPGSQYFLTMTPELEAEPEALLVPAGSCASPPNKGPRPNAE